jgi:hypothetical protein
MHHGSHYMGTCAAGFRSNDGMLRCFYVLVWLLAFLKLGRLLMFQGSTCIHHTVDGCSSCTNDRWETSTSHHLATYIHTYTHPYVHTYIHTHIHTNIHTHIRTRVQQKMNTRTYLHTCAMRTRPRICKNRCLLHRWRLAAVLSERSAATRTTNVVSSPHRREGHAIKEFGYS